MRKRVPDVTAREVCGFTESPSSAVHATGVEKCQPIFLASIWPFAAIAAGVDGKGVWGQDSAGRDEIPAFAGMTARREWRDKGVEWGEGMKVEVAVPEQPPATNRTAPANPLPSAPGPSDIPTAGSTPRKQAPSCRRTRNA